MKNFEFQSGFNEFPLQEAETSGQLASDSEKLQQLKAVVRMATGQCPNPNGIEKRKNPRVPFPFPVEISLPENSPKKDLLQEDAVIGRFLSCQGFDFYHKNPLPSPYYRLTIPCLDQPIEVMLKITWTKSTGLGWWESGGRFVGT